MPTQHRGDKVRVREQKCVPRSTGMGKKIFFCTIFKFYLQWWILFCSILSLSILFTVINILLLNLLFLFTVTNILLLNLLFLFTVTNILLLNLISFNFIYSDKHSSAQSYLFQFYLQWRTFFCSILSLSILFTVTNILLLNLAVSDALAAFIAAPLFLDYYSLKVTMNTLEPC